MSYEAGAGRCLALYLAMLLFQQIKQTIYDMADGEL